MKIKLLKNVGLYGIVIGEKTFFTGSHIDVEIDGAEEGVLYVNERPYSVVESKTSVFEQLIMPGPNKVKFSDKTGTYNCGVINKNGRYITVTGASNELVLTYADALEKQGRRIEELEAAFEVFKKQYGISII